MWALIGSFTRIYPIDFSSPPATLGFPQAKKEGPLSFPPAALFHLPPLLIAGTFHRWFTALISERRKGGKRKKRPLSLLTFSPLAYDKVRKAPRCEEFCFFFSFGAANLWGKAVSCEPAVIIEGAQQQREKKQKLHKHENGPWFHRTRNGEKRNSCMLCCCVCNYASSESQKHNKKNNCKSKRKKKYALLSKKVFKIFIDFSWRKLFFLTHINFSWGAVGRFLLDCRPFILNSL